MSQPPPTRTHAPSYNAGGLPRAAVSLGKALADAAAGDVPTRLTEETSCGSGAVELLETISDFLGVFLLGGVRAPRLDVRLDLLLRLRESGVSLSLLSSSRLSLRRDSKAASASEAATSPLLVDAAALPFEAAPL